ncbi:MAG: hypothetical protein FJX92_08850 [Bacteroidetes bacterium]|nr:hypothetical protein [Bacteroidota bacterium]
MPKQDLKSPKFRCNGCKEYHFAPVYKTILQCPIHGYLCNKHVSDYSWKNPIAECQIFGKEEDCVCGKATVKYLWSEKHLLWHEDGKIPTDMDVKQSSRNKIPASKTNVKLKVLLDLFASDVLTKEQFLKQMNDALNEE